jgi:hypothetical protein
VFYIFLFYKNKLLPPLLAPGFQPEPWVEGFVGYF